MDPFRRAASRPATRTTRPRSPGRNQFTTRIGLELRPCRQEDLPALEWMGLFTRHRKIIHDTFAQQQFGTALMLLAITNEFPLAQVWLDFARRGSEQRPWLWALRVFPPLRGHGIGTWLIAAAEHTARERKAHEIELGAEPHNAAALRFYDRLGYRAVDTRVMPPECGPDGQPIGGPVELEIMRKRLEAG